MTKIKALPVKLLLRNRLMRKKLPAILLLILALLAVGAALLVFPRGEERRRRERGNAALFRSTAEIFARERGERQRLLAEFGADLRTKCAPRFAEARRGVPAAVKRLGSPRCAAALGTAALRDLRRGGNAFGDTLSAYLDAPVFRPCLEAERDAEGCLAEYELKLRENHLRCSVALAAELRAETVRRDGTEAAPERLLRLFRAGAGATVACHTARTGALLGTALELLLLKSSFRAAAKLFAAAAARFGSSIGSAGICAAADGPLPVGDIVGGLLVIGGGLWTAYDLYEAFHALPPRMERELLAGIDDAERQLFAEAEKRAAELDGSHRRAAETLAAALRRELNAGNRRGSGRERTWKP